MSTTIRLAGRGCSGHGQSIGLVNYVLYHSLLIFVEDLREALIELRLILLHFCKEDGMLVLFQRGLRFNPAEHSGGNLLNNVLLNKP